MASAPNTVHNSREQSPVKEMQKLSVRNQELYFETFRPDFTIRTKKDPPEIRQQRRRTLGIEEADLQNYESRRRGLTPEAKRKQRKKKTKDFKKLNMKGFAAKISATLESRQKVSTKTLARLMNLNVKCLGDGSLRKRCA